MKPFDLKAALAGAPVVTNSGKSLAWLAHDPGANNSCRVLGRINGQAFHCGWSDDGICSLNNDLMNLFMAPVKREGWVNVYRFSFGQPTPYRAGEIYDSLEQAKQQGSKSAIATARIEWEE